EPRRPAEPRCPLSRAALPSRTALPHRTALHCPPASAAIAATAAPLATAPIATMASPTVLTFDAEGRAVDFDVWVDNSSFFSVILGVGYPFSITRPVFLLLLLPLLTVRFARSGPLVTLLLVLLFVVTCSLLSVRILASTRLLSLCTTLWLHAAPHFLWPFAIQYAAHQINLQPHVFLPETTPTRRWTGKVGDVSAFRFYHPTSRPVLSSQDVTFDESVSYYHLFPYRTASLPPPPLFLVPDPAEPVEVAVDSGAARGAEPAGAGIGGAEPGGADSGGAASWGAERACAESGGSLGVPLRQKPLSPQRLREWYTRHCRRATSATGGGAAGPGGVRTGGTGAAGASAAGGAAGAGAAGGAAGAGATGGAAGAGAAGGAAGAEAAGGAAFTGAAGGAAGAGATGGAAGAGATIGAAGAGAAVGAAGAGAAGGAAGARATGGAAGAGAAGGAAGAGPAGGAAGAGATGGAAGAGATMGAAGAGAAGGAAGGGAARGAVGAGAPGGAAGAGAAGAAGGGTGAISLVSGGAAQPRPYYVPLLRQVLGLPPSPGPTPPLLSPPPIQSQSPLLPSSPLPGPSPYSRPTRGLMERREPESRPVSPVSRAASGVRTARAGRILHPCPPPALGTHSMTLRPSTATHHIPLPSPLASSLPDGSDPSTAASALVAELVDFASACRLDYATSLVAESASAFVCPPSVGGECALGTDVLEDRQEEFECFAAALPHLESMLLAREGDLDAPDILTPRSYAEAIEGTYVDEVPPPGTNIVSGMWIFRVKRPPGSPPVFKARYVARGFSQRHGVDFFQTFSPTPKMTTLRVLLHVAAQHDYQLHLIDFSTAFLQGSLHEEIWLRCPRGFTGSFPDGTQWSLRRPVFGLRQAPHDLVFATADTEALAYVKARCTITLTQSHMVQQVLQRFGFTYSSPQSTPLPTSHSLSAPPSDESVEPSGPYPELVGCLMYLMTCTRLDLAYPLSLLARYVAPGRHRKVHWDAAKRVLRYLCSTTGMGLVLGGRARVVLTGHADASWVDDLATQRSSQGYTFSLGSGSVSWRSTRSSSVLSSSCEAELYAGAMAIQELCWLTYLLTDSGEAPRSPPVLMKHIALRYFLARELQQRGQLCLAYVASQANTADVFTKALQPCDHQRFCSVLGLVPTVPHLLTC
ncbi:unnamed protein product, partial [Closterium sp. NIES-53]